MILVIGASGYIGSHIYSAFKAESLPVIGTYNRHPENGLIPFDMEKQIFPILSFEPEKISHMIIAASSTVRIDQVGQEWNKSHTIDVVNAKAMLTLCKKYEITPVYLSSDFVFDGEKGNYSETDPTNPINGYGKIKDRIESYIREEFESHMIIRMGKVFGIQLNDHTLITSIINDLKKGLTLYCSSDQVFTPVMIFDLVNFLVNSIKNKTTGTFHIASIGPITRYEMALRTKQFFNLPSENIISCYINSLGLTEVRPLKIDLNISKYNDLTGKKVDSLESYLEMIKDE